MTLLLEDRTSAQAHTRRLPQTAPSSAPLPPARQAGSPPALMWMQDAEEMTFELGDLTRIGRSLNAELHLEDVSVSRRHALIMHHPDGRWLLHDDRGLNGTYLNGRRVEGPTELQHGDVIAIGAYRMRLML